MCDERGADCTVATLDLAKDARMEVAGDARGIDGLCHQIGHAWMRGMAFDHDRTASGQRGGGVPTCGGKGEREV